jgi:hypothetical protein
MALLTRNDALANFDGNSAMKAPQITKICGEDIDPVSPCYVASDDKLYMSDGTANNKAAQVDGFSGTKGKAGQPLTIYGPGVIMRYNPGALTPGDNYFVAATKGRLDTAATVGDAQGVARAYDNSHIRVLRLK